MQDDNILRREDNGLDGPKLPKKWNPKHNAAFEVATGDFDKIVVEMKTMLDTDVVRSSKPA